MRSALSFCSLSAKTAWSHLSSTLRTVCLLLMCAGDACRFALEARRLGGPDCEEIARRLDSVRTEAEVLR